MKIAAIFDYLLGACLNPVDHVVMNLFDIKEKHILMEFGIKILKMND